MAETLSVTDMLPNKFEPKRNYRWVLAVEGIDAFLVASTNRPQVNIGDKKIDFINSYRRIASKLEFQDLLHFLQFFYNYFFSLMRPNIIFK